MISALNLIWIIPVCLMVGGSFVAFFIGASNLNSEYDSHQSFRLTLWDMFVGKFNSDFEVLKKITGGIVYGEDTNGQLSMIFIESLKDLYKYRNNIVINISDDGPHKKLILKVGV